MSRRQGRYWLCTIPSGEFSNDRSIDDRVAYVRGQREIGERTSYEHWQLLVILKRKGSCNTMQEIFGRNGHYELSRSDAADSYVWKEETAIPGTRFELGERPIRRNNPTDWDSIWESATAGNIMAIPSDIRIRHFGSICRIGTRFAKGVAMVRRAFVFWGPTGTGKSRTAWDEAGVGAFPKDPRTKWWDGYTGEENVVVDEFRGGIDVAHLLRWLDRYPVLVETKGGTIGLRAQSFWFTSNLHPRDWYPDLDEETRSALLRRLEIKNFVKL